MNDKHKQLFTRIKTFSFDNPGTEFTFSQRLARENDWSIEYTNRVIEEYRKFIFLAVVAEHIVTPSEQVDRVWHLHLTYTRSYWNEFCLNVLGQPLHHQPTEGGYSEQEKYDNLYRKTLNSYIEFFGDKAPIDIWSSPDMRFGKDLSSKWVNTEDHWIISKPNISLLLKKPVENLLIKFNKTATVVVSLFLILFITLGVALPGLAKNAPFYWDFINVTLDVRENGDLLVTEEQKYVFTGSNSHQRYRFIKLDPIKNIKDVEVFEDNHHLPVETYIKDGKFWIRWQDYLDNTDAHIFTLKYRAIGALTNSYGRDTLNWKAIFPKREAEVNNSEIAINLPESLSGKIQKYYSVGGNFKSTLIDDTTIKFSSLQAILPQQSTIIKLVFSGNFLDLKNVNSVAVSKNKVHHTVAGYVFGYLLVGFVLLVFIACIVLFVFVLYGALTSSLKKNKFNSSGGDFGGCGGCGGGCGGGG